jgi:HEAT repeat protein
LKAFPANLLASLNATDPLVREKAARDAAYNSDPQIVAALVALLNDPVAKVRETAAESLVNESNPAVIPFEIRTLQSGTDLIARMRAAEALGKLHATSAVDALIAALSDPSPAIWSKAVVALGQIGDPSAAQPIAASMRVFRFSWYDPSLALSKLGEPGLNAILPLLKSNDEWMRILAAQGLQLFKGPRVTTALISALQDPSDAVRGDAAGSLGSIGDPAAVDPLMEALQRPGRSKDAIAAVLGRLGDRRSVPVLIAELHNPISTFESAAIMRALGDLGGAQALETLIQTLQGRFQSKHVFEDLDRQYAAESIGRIGGERADSVLLEFLRKQDLPVIQGGARYLIAAGHDGSDALLARALDPQNKTLRMLADLYLASDNPLLTSAAQAWARTQGLTISSETYKPVKWKQGTLPK